MAQINHLNLPDSLRDSIAEVANHYERYIDVMDVDQTIREKIDNVIYSFSGRKNVEIGDNEPEPESDFDPECPGK